MASLRHFAIAAANADETAKFYENAFGMKRVRESATAVLLSDGIVSLAILNNQVSHEAMGESGLHHFGVIAEDVAATAALAEKYGARYADKDENVAKRYANRGQTEDGRVTAEGRAQDQRKYVDPNGVKFDIANAAHARNSWRLPV